MAVKMFVVLCAVMPCGLIGCYQYLVVMYCLLHQGEVNCTFQDLYANQTNWSSKTYMSTHCLTSRS
jgi:hypothetical protein